MLKIYCKDSNCKPTRAHPTDAGLDLRTSTPFGIKQGEEFLVPTAVHVEIPEHYVGLVFIRSGIARKRGIILKNSVGVIDSDYRGEIFCAIQNTSNEFQIVDMYERIAQLVVVPCVTLPHTFVDNITQLSNTDRGDGGFGSTGV